MTAKQNLVKTMEPVQTWSTTTNVFVLQDSMGQIVKTVSAMITHTIFVCGNEKKYKTDDSSSVCFIYHDIDNHWRHRCSMRSVKTQTFGFMPLNDKFCSWNCRYWRVFPRSLSKQRILYRPGQRLLLRLCSWIQRNKLWKQYVHMHYICFICLKWNTIIIHLNELLCRFERAFM